VPETIEVDLHQRLDGQRLENSLYFHKTGGWVAADVPVVYNALLLWWNANLSASQSNQLTLAEISIVSLESDTAFSFDIATPVPNPAGDVTSGSVPNNVALCVSIRTDLRGRSYRGRNYVPGLPVNQVTQNTVSAPTVAAIQTSYNDLIAVASGFGAQWVVVSRYTGNAPRVTGVHRAVTSALIVDATVDSQRRRLPGRGL
jgi:hypothetical protein